MARQKSDFFTRVEWCLFRLFMLLSMLLLMFRLLRAEVTMLF